ncbi:MAG TPA: 50S ribosomal protein L22 [Patescibacteria group bacterium]|nr:50S ribosomal protein L22 [Patescibacteria group bacterium]
MSQEVTAQLRFFRMGPRKMRLLADLIRGRHVEKAITTLSLLNKRGALPLLKLVQSAVANAKHNHSLEVGTLRVKSITVDGGPMLKRWMPKAHGRATPVRERTSHVKLVLEQVEKTVKEKKPKNKSI